jgi:SAM-dependent methyltransferase
MIRRDKCPICAGPADVIFSRPYQHPALLSMVERYGQGALVREKPYEIRGCAACDLYFQTWVLEATESADWYRRGDGMGSFLEQIARQKLHAFAHQTEEILVLRQLCAAERPVVLDYGCNWGKWASVALAHGCAVYGVEVNPHAAAFCAGRGIRMIDADQTRELQFDFINADQVVEHLSDPVAVGQGLARRLKPNGFLKVSTPGNARLPWLLAAAQRADDDTVLDPQTLDSLYPLEHVNLFSNRSLRGLGAKAGLLGVRLPLLKWFGAGQLWNLPRQLNRNLTVPFRRWLGRGTYLWFQKPGGRKPSRRHV